MTYTFEIVETAPQLQQVKLLRQLIYTERLQYLLDDEVEKSDEDTHYDDYSYNFLLKNSSGEAIGAARLTPFRNNRWEASTVIPQEIEKQLNTIDDIQINRVIIKKEYRGLRLHQYIFINIANWVLTHTKYNHYIALCTLTQARLYAQVGVSAIGDSFSISNRKNEKYHIVRGNVANVVRCVQEAQNYTSNKLSTTQKITA